MSMMGFYAVQARCRDALRALSLLQANPYNSPTYSELSQLSLLIEEERQGLSERHEAQWATIQMHVYGIRTWNASTLLEVQLRLLVAQEREMALLVQKWEADLDGLLETSGADIVGS